MNTQIDRHILDKVNDEHKAVISSSKEAIQHAINAGELLTQIKDMCQHGEFLDIVNSGAFNFKQATAYNYIKVYEYSAKLQALGNLQEAYKLIESEESKKKAAEAEVTREKLAYRDKYGEKPNTWQRADDYAWKKLQEERLAREERIADLKDTMTQASKEKTEESDSLKADTERLKNYFSEQASNNEKLLGLNIVNQNGSILDFISNYLNSLDTDSQRIEECHNIIKYCKSISVELQQSKKVGV